MPAPPVWALPADLGLVLIASVAGWRGTRHWPADARRLLWIAAGMGLVWLYAPVPYQRRFAFGVQPVLALLAAAGLLWVNAWMREHAWGPIRRRLVNYSVALAAVMTSIIVLAGLLASVVLNAPTPVYLLSAAEQRAADWLAQNSTAGDVVLASKDVSNPLVGTIAGRTVHGHPVATRDARMKAAHVDVFYAAATPASERLAIARRLEATMVIVGPSERALGSTGLGGVDGLERVYEQDGVQVFRLTRAG
jgi:hypothetical protein